MDTLSPPATGFDLHYQEMLAAVPGLTYRQLDHWTRRGFISCLEQFPGSGINRWWSIDDALALKRVVALSSRGVAISHAFRLARNETAELAPGVTIEFTGDLT